MFELTYKFKFFTKMPLIIISNYQLLKILLNFRVEYCIRSFNLLIIKTNYYKFILEI